MKNVMFLNKDHASCFLCHTSTSLSRDVAESFRGGPGCLATIRGRYYMAGSSEPCDGVEPGLPGMRILAAPVAWISRFPDEEEVLITRHHSKWFRTSITSQSATQQEVQIDA